MIFRPLPALPAFGKGFRRFATGQALSAFGDSLVPLTVAFAVLDLTGSAADLGLVLLANRLPFALLVLMGGALADRWPRRRMMLAADVLRCLSQGICGVLLVTGDASIGLLVALQACAGAGAAMFAPASTGLVPELVAAEQLIRANAVLSLANNVTKVASIGCAGALVAVLSPGWALVVDAITFAASAAFLAALPETVNRRHPEPPPGALTLLAGGWRYVSSTPWIATLVLYGAMFQLLVIGPHMVLGPVVAERDLGGAGAWAAIGVAQAVGSVTGGVVAWRARPRRPLWTGIATAMLMVPYLVVLALAAPVWLVAAAAFAVGVQGSVYWTWTSTAVQTAAPASVLSRVASYQQLGPAVLMPVALAATGPVAESVGASAVLVMAAIWVTCSTAAVLSVPAVRSLRPEPAVPAADVPLPPAASTGAAASRRLRYAGSADHAG